MTYRTKQKEMILNLLKEYHKEFTVKEIHEKLDCGLTTVYRLVDSLTEEGQIKKIINGNNVYYQYLDTCDEENHFYLKCDCCGLLIHIDCDCILDLQDHILNEHEFKFASKNIIINGICKNCLRKENKKC